MYFLYFLLYKFVLINLILKKMINGLNYINKPTNYQIAILEKH